MDENNHKDKILQNDASNTKYVTFIKNPLHFVQVRPNPVIKTVCNRNTNKNITVKCQKESNEDIAEWQQNLDIWKANRRKLQGNIIERVKEIKQFKSGTKSTNTNKIKTFNEIISARGRDPEYFYNFNDNSLDLNTPETISEEIKLNEQSIGTNSKFRTTIEHKTVDNSAKNTGTKQRTDISDSTENSKKCEKFSICHNQTSPVEIRTSLNTVYNTVACPKLSDNVEDELSIKILNEATDEPYKKISIKERMRSFERCEEITPVNKCFDKNEFSFSSIKSRIEDFKSLSETSKSHNNKQVLKHEDSSYDINQNKNKWHENISDKCGSGKTFLVEEFINKIDSGYLVVESDDPDDSGIHTNDDISCSTSHKSLEDNYPENFELQSNVTAPTNQENLNDIYDATTGLGQVEDSITEMYLDHLENTTKTEETFKSAQLSFSSNLEYTNSALPSTRFKENFNSMNDDYFLKQMPSASDEDDIIKKEKEIIELVEKEEKTRVNNMKIDTYRSQLCNETCKTADIHIQNKTVNPSLCNAIEDRDSEVLRVEQELLQLEREELKRQRANLLYCRSNPYKYKHHSYENIVDVENFYQQRDMTASYRQSMPELKHTSQLLNWNRDVYREKSIPLCKSRKSEPHSKTSFSDKHPTNQYSKRDDVFNSEPRNVNKTCTWNQGIHSTQNLVDHHKFITMLPAQNFQQNLLNDPLMFAPTYSLKPLSFQDNTVIGVNNISSFQTANFVTPLIRTKENTDAKSNSTSSSNNNIVLSVSGRKKCSKCGNELGRGAAMIIESLYLFYHMECFKCCVCLVQLGNGLMGTDVRVRNRKLHCHNCFSNDDGIKLSCV